MNKWTELLIFTGICITMLIMYELVRYVIIPKIEHHKMDKLISLSLKRAADRFEGAYDPMIELQEYHNKDEAERQKVMDEALRADIEKARTYLIEMYGTDKIIYYFDGKYVLSDENHSDVKFIQNDVNIVRNPDNGERLMFYAPKGSSIKQEFTNKLKSGRYLYKDGILYIGTAWN